MNNDLVIMERQNIVDIADALRNKTGVNDEMTLADMVTSINEIETGVELPSAENSVFGMTSQAIEYGMTNSPSGMQQLAVTASGGVEYKANVPFAILGVRVYPARQSWSGSVYIWNEKGELLRQVDGLSYSGGGWTEPIYLTQPLNIKAGEIFIISMTWYDRCGYMNKSKVVFNSKIAFQCGRYIKAREGFPDQTNASNVYGMPDIIIGDIVEELPLEYQIDRVTMDDIAEEVQRITGTETKMSTAQIQSGLESVVLQEKSVTPTVETQTITPDGGYYGLSKVTVNPALLQEKTVTPTTEQQEIVPDAGYYGFSKVTVEAVEDSGGGNTLAPNEKKYQFANTKAAIDVSLIRVSSSCTTSTT